MSRILPLTLSFLFPASLIADPVIDSIPRVFKTATTQARTLTDAANAANKNPRGIDKDGKLRLVDPEDWTSGFFPGVLWFLYEYSHDEAWQREATTATARLKKIRHFKDHHDVGFMLGCSYGNALRLAPDADTRKVLLDGAASLATRYSPKLGLIRSWDYKPYTYPVIIDNMMNLELLTWAAKNGGATSQRELAISHADKTQANHFRADHSAYHVLDYDPDTSAVRAIYANQGRSVHTAWSRGQAWAIYGYTMMHRQTGKPEYLQQAMATANFVAVHPNLPADKVPYWDFGAPASANTPRDASAAAIMASALIELSHFCNEKPDGKYITLARQQLTTLASPAYLAKPGANHGFLLFHSTGHLPEHSEIDVPLIYADYYFLEALLRYKALATSQKHTEFGAAK